MFYSIFKISNYIHFKLTSTNQHGVHSPFIYQLVTKCIYKKTLKKERIVFQKYRNEYRQKSGIKNSFLISNKYILLLNRLVEYLQIKNILVLEDCSGNIKNVIQHGHSKINIDNNLPTNTTSNKVYDLICFARNHQQETALNYFKQCVQLKHNDSVFIFDDIYKSKEMKKNWLEIKNHPEVTVTVDLFQWGLVFFRKEQQKEHFKIRF